MDTRVVRFSKRALDKYLNSLLTKTSQEHREWRERWFEYHRNPVPLYPSILPPSMPGVRSRGHRDE